MAIADSFATGGSVAIVLGAFELVRFAIAKRNHRKNNKGAVDFTAIAASNSTKIDSLERAFVALGADIKDYTFEVRENTKEVSKLVTILEQRGG